jgi:gamma-glutamyltranspeptidase / glutathione hydrolase
LHGRHWVALTGKPAGAVAGARMFERGGNAIDAACAMLAVVCTMHDDVGWGGETQALIYDPRAKKVVGINACGVAPTGATPELFKAGQQVNTPGEGTPGGGDTRQPGGLMVMLAEFGTLSLREVLEPAMQMADGYPIEADLVRKIEHHAAKLQTVALFGRGLLSPSGPEPEAPRRAKSGGNPTCWKRSQKLVDTEAEALRSGKDRKEAIYAAYDRFYRGDIAAEFVRGSREQGGLHTLEDLSSWERED